jgi:hypothetical protein
MWISKLVVDLIDCTIRLEGTADPERAGSALELIFREVGNVRVERYHDLDNAPCLGDFNLIRAEDLGDGRARFRTDTGDAMLVFEAAANPGLTVLEAHQIKGADIFISDSPPAASPSVAADRAGRRGPRDSRVRPGPAGR